MTRTVVRTLVAFLCTAAAARSDVIVTKPAGGDDIAIFRTPTVGLPNAAMVTVSGLSADNHQPHGVDCYGNTCVVGDFRNPRLFIVDALTATLAGTLDTPSSYNGKGTVAVNRAGTFVLTTSTDDPLTATEAHVAVIATPVTPASTVGQVPLPGILDPAATEAIAFDPQDRAFVCHRDGVSVLDPPYTAIAFTIPLMVPPFPPCVSLALSPDGGTLLVPEATFGVFEGQIRVFTAPFSAASTYERIRIPDTDAPPFSALNGITVSPDGGTALVVSAAARDVWAIAAPFGSSSAVERLPLPSDGSGVIGFEDVIVSPDGQLAILAGQGNLQPFIPFILAPFTAAAATAYNVPIAGGRGSGAARFVFPSGAGGTTTTTLPPGAEVCGDCVDNDGNGFTDFEDPACCPTEPGLGATLRRGRAKPAGTASRLALSAALTGASAVNPRQQDVRVQLRHEDGGAELVCATLPAARFAPGGKAFKFRDKTGEVASAQGISSFRMKVKKDGRAKVKIRGRQATLVTPPAGSLRLTLGFDGASTADDRCASATGVFRAGKKGSIRFP